jgi:hypothetical protein
LQFGKNSHIKSFWHISALLASRWKQSDRAKVPILVLITITILYIAVSVELLIPRLLDIQLENYVGRLDLEEETKVEKNFFLEN